MSQIAERTARVAELLEAVRNHPMCGELQDTGDCFRVIYPAGDFPVAGVQSVVRRGEGRAVALEKLVLGNMRLMAYQMVGSRNPWAKVDMSGPRSSLRVRTARHERQIASGSHIAYELSRISHITYRGNDDAHS